MKKIFFTLALALLASFSYAQTFDLLKEHGGNILKGKISKCDSSFIYFSRIDFPSKVLAIGYNTLAAVYVADTSMQQQICRVNSRGCSIVSQKSDMVLSGSNGIPMNNQYILSDSLSRVALSYHLDRAGVNLNAGERLGLLSLLVGGCTVFAKNLNQVKTISGIAAGLGLIGLGVRISGGKHLILAGQKIRYRK